MNNKSNKYKYIKSKFVSRGEINKKGRWGITLDDLLVKHLRLMYLFVNRNKLNDNSCKEALNLIKDRNLKIKKVYQLKIVFSQVSKSN